METCRVIELFAGVGGFRVGLENADREFYRTIWANQWEPTTKDQHAWRTYERVFGQGSCSNVDIADVPTDEIPDHDLLVGGFPCQDYSVATSSAKGIEGKKGVLWWQVVRIAEAKRPAVLLLENVDRLLKSPASQRGRDFGIILQSLADLGYSAEWRVINSADYGFAQRRRRTYILAYRDVSINDPAGWILRDGVLAKAFPVKEKTAELEGQPIKGIDDDLADVSRSFSAEFCNAGVMVAGAFYTTGVTPDYDGHQTTLGDVLVSDAPGSYYLKDEDMDRWEYLKGAKDEPRQTRNGYWYRYTEGPLAFPDPLDRPSRTVITSEGGPAPSRTKHVVRDPWTGRLRRLTPVELERLDGFPDNHTAGESDTKRAFFCGNALIVGVIERIANSLKTEMQWM